MSWSPMPPFVSAHQAWIDWTRALCLAMAIGLGLVPARAGAAGLSVTQLRCEQRIDPLGVDVPTPWLSWVLTSAERGDAATACQVLVATDAATLAADRGDCWDSGRLPAGEGPGLAYGGAALRTGGRYFWKMRVWDAAGRASAWSEPASWTCGLMRPGDMAGRWISGAVAATTKPSTGPMPLFRRAFTIDRPVRRAVAFVCGLGQFDLHVNGEKVGDALLDPGWTDYRKTCLYVTFDLTDRLRQGENVAAVMLGNGMYNVPAQKGRYQKWNGSVGPPVLIGQVRIEYADGTVQTVVTDKSWKTADGPITFSSTYGGEDYDARRAAGGWDRAGFDDTAWTAAQETDGPGGRLAGLSRSAPPTRAAQTFAAVAVTEPKPGVFVYDFGQNAAMMPRLTVEGPRGAAVRMSPGELLNPDGTVSQETSGEGVWFTYTLAGEGRETWTPRFTYYGGRYVQIAGAVPAGHANAAALPVVVSAQSVFVTSDATASGSFTSSSELFDRTNTLIRWAMRSNMQSVLTDCPHREKLGWLEQVHLVGPSLMYNFDVQSLMRKTCWDMADAQRPDGLVPDIAPEFPKFKGGFVDSPEWGSACVLIPWQLYEWYGDAAVLADQYDVMRRYVAYLDTKAKGHILSHGLGDWYDLGPKKPGEAQLTPKALTATAFFYRDLSLLARIAGVLGKTDDAARYAAAAGDVAAAFDTAFYHPAAHTYATGSQTANALPLVFGLVPDADRSAVLDSLIADIRGRDNALTAGDIGYRHVLRALADGGRSDVIYDMNSRSDRPGYGYILARGATSLTEGWDGSASQNHFMLGHIMEWFYGGLVGLRPDPSAVGFRRFFVRPTPVGPITAASASYDSVRGTIRCAWTIDGPAFTLDLLVPPGATADVRLPAAMSAASTEGGVPLATARGVSRVTPTAEGLRFDVASGQYHFVSRRE